MELAQDIGEDVDVVIIPPEPSADTDEEEGDDDSKNIVKVNDVTGKKIKFDKY